MIEEMISIYPFGTLDRRKRYVKLLPLGFWCCSILSVMCYVMCAVVCLFVMFRYMPWRCQFVIRLKILNIPLISYASFLVAFFYAPSLYQGNYQRKINPISDIMSQLGYSFFVCKRCLNVISWK